MDNSSYDRNVLLGAAMGQLSFVHRRNPERANEDGLDSPSRTRLALANTCHDLAVLALGRLRFHRANPVIQVLHQGCDSHVD